MKRPKIFEPILDITEAELRARACEHVHFSTSAVECGYVWHELRDCYLTACDNCNAVLAHHNN